MAKWKPKIGETSYAPWLLDCNVDCIDAIWSESFWDERWYTAGIVCRTEEEALELAERMLAVAKEEREQND